MKESKRMRLFHKLVIASLTSVSLLASVQLALSCISDELWQLRVVYILGIIYLFGVAPIILLYYDRKMNKEGRKWKEKK